MTNNMTSKLITVIQDNLTLLIYFYCYNSAIINDMYTKQLMFEVE